jgi:hypothetical protein
LAVIPEKPIDYYGVFRIARNGNSLGRVFMSTPGVIAAAAGRLQAIERRSGVEGEASSMMSLGYKLHAPRGSRMHR